LGKEKKDIRRESTHTPKYHRKKCSGDLVSSLGRCSVALGTESIQGP